MNYKDAVIWNTIYRLSDARANQLEEQIKIQPMAKKFTNSQKLRIRLSYIYKSDNHGFDTFEDFYEAIYDVISENLDELLKLVE